MSITQTIITTNIKQLTGLQGVTRDLKNLMAKLEFFNFDTLCNYLEEIYILEEVFYHISSPSKGITTTEAKKTSELISSINSKINTINKRPEILEEIKDKVRPTICDSHEYESDLYGFQKIPKTFEEIVIFNALTPLGFEDRDHKLIYGERWLIESLVNTELITLPQKFERCDSVVLSEIPSVVALYNPRDKFGVYSSLTATYAAIKKLL